MVRAMNVSRGLAEGQEQLAATFEHPVFEGQDAFFRRQNTQDDAREAIEKAGSVLKKQQETLANLFKTEGLEDSITRSVGGSDVFSKAIRGVFADPKIKQAIEDGSENLGELLVGALGGSKNVARLSESFATTAAQIKTFTDATTHATNAVSMGGAAFEKADDGVISYREAITRAGEAVAKLKKQAANMRGLDLNVQAEAMISQGDERDKKDIVRSLEETIKSIELNALNMKMRATAIMWHAELQERIDSVSTGELATRLKTIAEDLGKGLKDATATFLTTGDATTFADALRDAIKKRVVDDSALQLSTSLMANLSPQIEELRSQMLSAFNFGTDLSGFEKFPETLQSIFANHPLGKLLGVDTAAQDFVKELRESISDANISLDVLLSRGDLDSVTSSFAERMRSIVSTSFTDTPQGVRNAADRFKALRDEATPPGAVTTVGRLVEGPLKSLLEAQKAFNDQPNSGLGKIVEASQTLKPVMDKGFEVGNLFIKGATMLGEAFSKAGNAVMSAVSPDAAGDRTIQVNIGPQTASVAVDISGSGDNLDEADVASIVDRTREALLAFVEEQIREVREQLDERTGR